MASDSNPFELVDDADDDDPPPPKKKPEPEPEPETEAADEPLPPLELEADLDVVADPGPEPSTTVPAGREDADAGPAVVEEILLEEEGEAPKTTADKELDDEGPTDGSTIRMSLADVVHAWDEEAPDPVAAATAAAAGESTGKDRSGVKRIAIMVLVIIAVLAVIVVIFGACAPVAHADEAAAPSVRGSDVPCAANNIRGAP